jgi:hypothetical protein
MTRGLLMILKSGDIVLVVHRRLFAEDRERFFLGAVEDYESGIAAVSGFTYVRESGGRFLRKDERRTKIVSIGSGTLIVYRLPEQFAFDDATIGARDSRLILSDRHGHEMNLSEELF